jgi:hypothetical protein
MLLVERQFRLFLFLVQGLVPFRKFVFLFLEARKLLLFIITIIKTVIHAYLPMRGSALHYRLASDSDGAGLRTGRATKNNRGTP